MPSDSPTPAAGPPTDPPSDGAGSPWIVDIDVSNFESEVIARSREIPVIVDFGATWCEPCKTLGPMLEKRALDGAGRFVLAKVDVDRSPDLAQAFRIQGVPAVMAVVGGSIANGFQGALPDEELDRFLDEVAPPIEREATPLEKAQAHVEEGDVELAIGVLAEHLVTNIDDEARLYLIELLIDHGKLDAAQTTLAALTEEGAETPRAKALADRLTFAQGAGDIAALRKAAEDDPEDAAARRALGEALLATQQHEMGLEELLEAVRLDPSGEGQAAKQKMLETFELLGLEDPVANDFRFKLSMVLFS